MKLATTMFVVAVVGFAVAVQAETLDHLKELWRAKKYQETIPLLLAYRNQAGGRTWGVDYMIGTSECRITGREQEGAAVLTYVLSNYRLPDNARNATEQELQFCQRTGSAGSPEPPFFYVPVAPQVASGPLVAGKGGYELSRTAVTMSKVETTPVPITELQKRVFTADLGQQALKAAKQRLPGSMDGSILNNFVLVCSGNCELPPKFVGECLVRYEAPLQGKFDMKMPSDLVTVYVARTPDSVSDDARRLHGVTLPLGTVAYSVYEDLSIVGMAAYDSCGSLAHELVHLAIRQNFGDSPAWLEEGLASEVAVAYPRGGDFQFEPSWRDDMLRKHWNQRPTVAQLLTLNWANYAASNVDQVDQVVAVQAMAACFIRYLDAKKKLAPVYFAIRDSGLSQDATVTRSEPKLLEQQLGMTLDQMDADFVRWFGGAPSNLKSSSSTAQHN